MSYQIVSLTGGDRVGKETQSRLLTYALTPSRRMSSPDYTHWSGQLVRAVLEEQQFTIGRGQAILREKGEVQFYGPWRQEKQPEIFQLLQAINLKARQPEIAAGLKAHHWIMDRYEIDALAFGTADGCSLEFLLDLARLSLPSDLSIVMLGSPFPRPGETPDLNERDPAFQTRVADLYRALATLRPAHYTILSVEEYRHTDLVTSIWGVHQALCGVIRERLGLRLTPCSRGFVADWVTAGKPERAPETAVQLELALEWEPGCGGEGG